MKINDSDEKLLQDIGQELDRSCDRLDAATLSRLNQIRHRALEAENRFFYQRPLIIGSTLTACALALFITLNSGVGSNVEVEDVDLTELENMEILSAEEGLEFYEDIDFYQWLSMNEEL